MFKVLKFACAALVAMLAVQTFAFAAKKPAPISLTEEQRAAISRVNTFINSFTTLKGEFVQTSDKGQSVRGVVMLSKPGKIRFDYAPPSPLLIVSQMASG
jgi:outer membrane lipoprotein-sorting protein